MPDENTDLVRARRLMGHLIAQIGDPGFCRGCGVQIFWITHRNGKHTPYTADGESHFVNCPKADEFRKTEKESRRTWKK